MALHFFKGLKPFHKCYGGKAFELTGYVRIMMMNRLKLRFRLEHWLPTGGQLLRFRKTGPQTVGLGLLSICIEVFKVIKVYSHMCGNYYNLQIITCSSGSSGSKVPLVPPLDSSAILCEDKMTTTKQSEP